jgi:hypothetical protein
LLGLLAAGVPVAHAWPGSLEEEQRIEVPGSSAVIVLWTEGGTTPGARQRYAVSLDGVTFSRPRPASPILALRYAGFDPSGGEPAVEDALRATAQGEVWIVQFVIPPIEPFAGALRELGAVPQIFLADQAWIVHMPAQAADRVRALPFVRWVGPMHPAYKLEELLVDEVRSGIQLAPQRCSILLFERGLRSQQAVASAILRAGGLVHDTTALGLRLEASLTLDELIEVARLSEVLFIDRLGTSEPDMDIARQIGGANFVHETLGYTGEDVRGEIIDTELELSHPEWKNPPMVHLAGQGQVHGTRIYGALFAQGLDPKARGLLPDAMGIFAFRDPLMGGGQARYIHTAELVDPAGPYRAVFQSASVGDSLTTAYSTISAEMDDILFLNDILVTQSQSNSGSQLSRPQAWAKNIIGCGGIQHLDTLDRSDDRWGGYASIGPAADGRVKPDLAHFCDSVYTTSVGAGYISTGGTSLATPIIAGHAGLMFQMWHEGVFAGFGGGPSVFDDRPHMTTAKALLVNSAFRYDWSQGGPNADLDRCKQGWGMPDLLRLHQAREGMLIVDESDLLQPFGLRQYQVEVESGDVELRATLIYADPRGNPSSSVHRINDLSLRVTDPVGSVYWGNVGLLDGNVSIAGGSSNTIDTVENVFVPQPEPGNWMVEVMADEIHEDSHTETPELDADFALVVAVEPQQPAPPSYELLWDNGPIVSHPDQGPGGADASVRHSLSLGESVMGYGHHVADGTRVADDFLLAEPSVLHQIEFWAYQVGAGAGNPTVNWVSVRVWDGPPGAPSSKILLGDATTNRLSSSAWDITYRVDESSISSGTTRAVYRNICSVPGWSLPSGHYWIDWQSAGILSSGPWVPPVTLPGQSHPPGADALQLSDGAWHPLIDAGSQTPDALPFVLRGHVEHDKDFGLASGD